MLYATARVLLYNPDRGPTVFEFHIGNKTEDEGSIKTHEIISIQADGEELALIKETFIIHAFHENYHCTIPFSNRLVQQWHGDIARSVWFAIENKLRYDGLASE